MEKDTNLEIILRDNTTYPVKGAGNVTLQLNQGNTIHLQEVLYVPNLKKNLVPISTMEDKGFKVAFIDGKVHVWKRNFKQAFTLGFKADNLYQVGGSPLGAMSCNTSLQSKLWCRRFAHLHYKALPDARKIVTGMLEFKIEHEGDEFFTWFHAFKALVENQTEKKIKILRTDTGTEYESNEFNDYCREYGIKTETTTAYIPEQNGVAKRKNRSIIEATHAMLHDQGLPKFLWGEVANTTVYIQNQCPHQALDSKTLEEVFTGKKPDVSHFRMFGSPIYFHVPKEKRSRLDASRKKGTFVGYSENSKAYRIYVPSQREVELSHDVTFDEDDALRNISNLPIHRKDKEADVGNQGDSQDESMSDVKEPMDPIDLLIMSPPPPKGDPHG
eukprot:PITA_15860